MKNEKKSAEQTTSSIVHPESRKAKQLIRTAQKSEKKNERKKLKTKAKMPLVEKISLFQKKLLSEMDKASFTYEDATNWIKEYLSRFDSEIEDLEKNNKKVTRLRDLKMLREEEAETFRTLGYEIPEIRNRRNVRQLREWNKSPNNIEQIELFSYKDSTYKIPESK